MNNHCKPGVGKRIVLKVRERKSRVTGWMFAVEYRFI